MKLDTTKVYYLGDLSDEQLEKVLEYLKSVHDFSKFNLDMFKKYLKQDNRKSLCYCKEFNGWSWCNNENAINALTLFDKTDYRDIILDEETYYNLDCISKEQYDELQNEYNGNRRFCIVDLQHKENKKEFKNVIDLFNNRRIISIQLRIQELNNELIELDEEMRRLSYDKKEN